MSSEPIPLSVPHINGNEWSYIKECLDTNWVSYLGSFVERFERELAAETGAEHAVAMASGTAALHIALILAGVGPGDEVIMPALTFVSPANAVRYVGAWPSFVDICQDDWQLNVAQVAEFLEQGCRSENGRLVNRATGRRVAALLPVHLLGGMCDVDAVAELATRYELPLIEDAAECLGASYKSRPIGADCPAYGGPLRLVATSFNGNKIITTGGGGALLTGDGELAARAKHFSTTAKADKMEFYHDAVGFNYRLTNVAAAMGVAQLENLERFVDAKRAHSRRYEEYLSTCSGIGVHPEPVDCRSTFWMYSVLLDRESRPVISALNDTGIMSRPLWVPMPRLPAFAGQAFSCPHPVAEQLYRDGLSLPCSVGLSSADQQRVAVSLVDLLETAL